MAGTLQIKHGAKMRVAYDAPVGQEPKFNMVCTFNKAIDESAFLVSVPMVGTKGADSRRYSEDAVPVWRRR